MQVANDTSIAASTPAAPTTPKASPTLDYDAFLRLLIAEMKNQDPTNPIDSTQYVAQLATFSGVEQAVKTNAKLDTLMTSLALSQADGLIGHTVASEDGTIVGQVVALRVVSGGAVAVLSDGQELELGPGVMVA
jgi:flagellar basal-body rod modification protein FlgD